VSPNLSASDFFLKQNSRPRSFAARRRVCFEVVVTGRGALEAAMGHFRRAPRSPGWLAICCRRVSYRLKWGAGRAADKRDPGNIRRPLMPGWYRLGHGGFSTMVVLANAATVIGLRRLITGRFR